MNQGLDVDSLLPLFGRYIWPEGSKIFRATEQNFKQNKRFLQALPAGRISHVTSRIYLSLSFEWSHLRMLSSNMKERITI